MRNSIVWTIATVCALGAGLWTIVASPRPPAPGTRASGPGNARRLGERPTDPDALEKWLEERTNDAEGWYLLGAARARQDRDEDAARAWTQGARSITRRPGDMERVAWNRYWVGWCLSRLDDHDAAREAWAQSVPAFEAFAAGSGGPRDKEQRPGDLYNLACARNLAGDHDAALATLREAIAAGWRDAAHATRDQDWASIRDDPRFEEALRPIGGLVFRYNGG